MLVSQSSSSDCSMEALLVPLNLASKWLPEGLPFKETDSMLSIVKLYLAYGH